MTNIETKLKNLATFLFGYSAEYVEHVRKEAFKEGARHGMRIASACNDIKDTKTKPGREKAIKPAAKRTAAQKPATKNSAKAK